MRFLFTFTKMLKNKNFDHLSLVGMWIKHSSKHFRKHIGIIN